MSIARLIHRNMICRTFRLKHVPHAAVDTVIKSMRLVRGLHIALTDKKSSQHLPAATGRSSDRTKK